MHRSVGHRALTGRRRRLPTSSRVRDALRVMRPGARHLRFASFNRRPRRYVRRAVMLAIALGALATTAPSASGQTYWQTSGIGLDTCVDPTVNQFHAFYNGTPYILWGIYIGGDNMGCSQPNLSANYIATITNSVGNSWFLAPVWVGPQDPCWSGSGTKFPSNTTDAYNWGQATAQNAYNELQSLGMGNGVPINDDLEGFGPGGSSCIAAAQAFVNGWSKFFTNAGVYGSIGSPCPGSSDLPAYWSISDPPEHIWGADWDGNSDTSVMGGCLGSEWSSDRLKQYIGPHDKTENGVTLQVDSDAVDGPLYGYPPQ